MGCLCSKSINIAEEGGYLPCNPPTCSINQDDSVESARVRILQPTSNLEEISCSLAPTPAIALLVDRLSNQDGQPTDPLAMLQELLECHENGTASMIVCTPSRYLQTARPIYSIREAMPNRAKTHRGALDGYFTPSGSPFGSYQLVTARSEVTLKRPIGVQRYSIATDANESEADYCYSETVWSRVESKDSGEWDFDWDSASARPGTVLSPRNTARSTFDISNKPAVPVLNMDLVAAIAARENAYLRAKDNATADRHVITVRGEQKRQSSARRAATSRTHRKQKGNLPLVWKEPDCGGPSPVQNPATYVQPPTSPAGRTTADMKGLTERPHGKVLPVSCSSEGSSILCTFRNIGDARPSVSRQISHARSMDLNSAVTSIAEEGDIEYHEVTTREHTQESHESGESRVEKIGKVDAGAANKLNNQLPNYEAEASTCCTELASTSLLAPSEKDDGSQPSGFVQMII